jgi:hypothetical protein
MVCPFFMAVNPACNFDCELAHCETFSTEGILSFGNIFLHLLTTSFPDTSPAPARGQIAARVFFPE